MSLLSPLIGYFVPIASAQTIPTFPASSTTAVVDATSDQLITSLTFVLQTIAPYAIAVGAMVMVAWFLVYLFKRWGN